MSHLQRVIIYHRTTKYNCHVTVLNVVGKEKWNLIFHTIEGLNINILKIGKFLNDNCLRVYKYYKTKTLLLFIFCYNEHSCP